MSPRTIQYIVKVELENVEIVDEFFKAIVEYLYVAPAKVDKIRELINWGQGKS